MNAPVLGAGWVEPVLGANAARIDKSFATGLRPPPRVSVSDWAAEHREFAEDAPYPGKWDRTRAAYLDEIMDVLSPHDPAAQVSIIKCAQSGGSASAENWMGYVSDVAPGPMMYVQATITAAKDWLAEKFWPMVEATPRLNPDRRGSIVGRRVKEGGSNANRVRFKRGGWMLIAGANSAATLRQHSIRYVVEDDLDQWPDDLNRQGSPEGMVTARLRAFTRQGIAKRLKISTPTNKGASKIGRAWAASDQRRYYLKCRHCLARFDPVFTDLKYPDGRPDQVKLITPCCQEPVAHWEKALMSFADGWLATAPTEDGEVPDRVMAENEFQGWRNVKRDGLQPGFHISGIITAFQTWADLCKGFVDAQGDVNALRTWTNLDLGDEFVMRGDAPPAESLQVLRSQEWDKHQLPYGPIVFTLACDVQGDGIYFEGLGWAFGLENWSLDHGFLPGPTDIPGQGAWAALEEYAKRTFVLPGGKAFGYDMIVVDAGYHTEGAKAFCKRRPNRLPVFGRDGWTLPILGRGQPIHYEQGKNNRNKRRKKAGEDAFLVGTYGAKLSWFGFLRASIETAQAELRGERPEPLRGRVHFGRHATDDYFDMLTSESCVVEVKRGHARRVWKPEPGRQNHWLDCRIYNRAAAEAMSLDSRSSADWLALQADRYASVAPGQDDLVARMINPVPAATPAPAPTPAQPRPQATETGDAGWIDNRKDWL